MVRAVRINCFGDQMMYNKPHFEAVEISGTDPIFYNRNTSDVANLIEFPILTRRCPPDPKWVDDQKNKMFERLSPFDNADATFLHLCCDPNAKGVLGWGWAPMQWPSGEGSVIVARPDKSHCFRCTSRHCASTVATRYARSLHTLTETIHQKSQWKRAMF